MRETFIHEGAALENPDHKHLRQATIGALWTNVANGSKGRRIIGQAQMDIGGIIGKWAAARAEMQMNEWFGEVPDFVITLDANYCAICGDAEFCALVEHELYHCAQAKDMFGQPRFSKATGLPIFEMRGHDVEEFNGIVRRYGADAAGVREMVDAAIKGPEIARVRIEHACGTCRLRVA